MFFKLTEYCSSPEIENVSIRQLENHWCLKIHEPYWYELHTNTVISFEISFVNGAKTELVLLGLCYDYFIIACFFKCISGDVYISYFKIHRAKLFTQIA